MGNGFREGDFVTLVVRPAKRNTAMIEWFVNYRKEAETKCRLGDEAYFPYIEMSIEKDKVLFF